MRSAAGNRNSIAGMRWGLISSAVVAGTVLVMGAAAWAQGHTYTKKVIYSFAGGSDGADPLAGLVRDAASNLYGTTYAGGDYGSGTVFKLDTTGKEAVLHSFSGGPDGGYPYAGLILDAAGNLYGTADAGGVHNYGAVFEMPAGGAEGVLYSFTGTGGDGADPLAGLIRDGVGNLYGTTASGGAFGLGTVFKVSAGGAETVLHSFRGGSDGEYPYASVIRDAAGNLYGTTYGGGASGWGTVFEINPTGKETVLFSFAGAADGASPEGGLVQDAAGHLYGTTKYGGTLGAGTVFELSPAR